MKFLGVVSALLATMAAATPTATVEKRDTTMCDAWGSVVTGGYTVYHNNWGRGDATSGSQCTTFTSFSGGSFVWSTSWTWVGGPGKVKSYSNVALEKINKKVSDIKSVPTKWTWRYTGTNMIANVAYDLWLAPTASSNNKYEIMIWVGAYGGAGPISENNQGPIDRPTIAGTTWSVYKGPNGDVTVFSFVAPSNLGNFQADLVGFLQYLTSKQGVPSDYVATSFQAGTEPFEGSNAVLRTTAYSISVS
ncbi:murein transglycosylase [Fusarium albosuccineum]|uniref:Murein transglycosylase n=1 Tax=Fusarium albosuccineum TaxID=1237068 RepID=A0A8H4LCY3_9HYPO|nr:murein transglycosylase [Fusarium albosuccineum]KAF4991680.1 hypothetical protein FDECE_13969 [Fusarium decemcellulare]